MIKQFFLSLLVFLTFIVSQSSAQTYIGTLEVHESNGNIYHVIGTENYKVDTENIILKFNSNTQASVITAFEQSKNLQLINIFDEYYVYKLPSNITYISYCQDLEQSSIVEYIESSVCFDLYGEFTPDDYYSDNQWFLELLGVPQAWTLTTGDEDIVVAVLDTGLEFDDEEFGPDDTPVSNLFQNPGEDVWSYWFDPEEGDEVDGPDQNSYIDDWQGIDLHHRIYDNQNNYLGYRIDNDVRPQSLSGVTYCSDHDIMYHGTWVSSLISAKNNNDNETASIAGGNVVKGRAGVSILPIKIGDWRNQSGCYFYYLNTISVLNALYYAREMNVDILNMSFGLPYPFNSCGSVNTQITNAYNEGMLLVASSGNGGYTIGVSYPAWRDEVISVGATDEDDEYASFSDRGPDLELMAPGVDIETWKDSGLNGTSFSSPIVCATAALMKSINPNLTNIDIRGILRETAFKNIGYGHPFNITNDDNFEEPNMGWDTHYGFGRVNTLAAVCASIDELPEITIYGNENWDLPRYSYNNITIESGAQLTVTDFLSMDPTAKIIVKPGGKLIINGGIITNLSCSGDGVKWKGIEVWGNPNESQQIDNGDYEQGYLELLNGAKIENAQTAILLGREGYYYAYGGGIVKAYDSYFTNNAKSVHFYPFKNMITLGNDPAFEGNNEAIFRNCEFTINENYFTDIDFYKHADVSKVKKIRFYACDFKRESNDATFDYCCGIESYSGGLSVNEFNSEPCTFEGLYCGIYITDNSATVNYDSYIQNSIFTNNSIGIKLNAMTNLVSIKENEFNVGYNDPEKGICGTSQAYGIFLDNSNTFVIEDNTFDKYVDAPSDGDFIGIEAFNTMTNTDEIFNNIFNDLTHANHAMNKNWYLNRSMGLEYYCNQHSNNNNDLFFVFDNPNNQGNSGVQISQGNQNKSTGNTFTQNISGYNLYNNTGHSIDYYYNVAVSNEIPFSYTSTTVNPHPQILAAECSGGGIEPKGLTASEKQSLENNFTISESNYGSVKTLYESLEDGGNTEALSTDVSTSWPNDMWELRAELLGLSPYLSTEILKTAADKTEVLPESVLFEILSANPDELKKMDLMEYLVNKEQPLPDYMISILGQLAEGQTAKTIMLNDMSRYQREKSRAALQMLVSLQYDEVFDFNNYRLWLNNLGGINSDRKIAASFVQEGNYTDALEFANLFPELYNLENEALSEHNYYMDMLNLDIILLQENRSAMQLNSGEYIMLEQIAENSEETAGAKARGILEHYYGEHYCNCVNTSVDENKSTSATIDPNQYAEAMGLIIHAEPNPAITWVAFDYELPIGNENGLLIIYNIDGKQIVSFQINQEVGQKVWDTRTLKSGTYFYEFISSELKQTGKIVIIK